MYDRPLPFPLQENQVHYGDFMAALVQPCLRTCMPSIAGSESLHLLDKLTCWSVKCRSVQRSGVTTTKANAIETKKFLSPSESTKVCERSYNFLLWPKPVADLHRHEVSRYHLAVTKDSGRSDAHIPSLLEIHSVQMFTLKGSHQ